MKIFGWLADRQGPGFYRLILPGTELANQGHAVWLDEKMPHGIAAGAADVIVGQRVCAPGPSATWQRLAREGNTKLVFETDDALDAITPDNRPAAAFFDDDTVRRYLDNMRVADVVTVSTDALAERCAAVNRNVHVLPNRIPGWLLDHARPSTLDRLTIGWRGGPSHGRDFGELARPLRRFLNHPAHRDRVEFHAMGADYTPRVAGNHAAVRTTSWLPGVGDYLRAVDFDVAVVPLRPSPFNDCKSDLAVLELAALGVPAIASDTGPYAAAWRAGAPVRLCDSADEWTAALHDYTGDAELLALLAKTSREWAAGRTIEQHAHRWAEAYES